MLRIEKEKCISCGICEDSCTFGSIKMQDGFPAVDDTCVFCGNCERDCPQGAITISVGKASADFSEYRDVWAVMELHPAYNHLQKVSLELLSEARKLSDRLGQRVGAVLLCNELPPKFEQQVEEVGCDVVHIVQGEGLQSYNTEVFAGVIKQLVGMYKPAGVLFPATETGRDLAPRVACELQVGLTADCTALDIDEEGNLVQIRPTYGGNIMASIISPNHRPQMASVRPNVFPVVRVESAAPTELIYEKIQADENRRRVRLIKTEEKESVFKNVAESDIVVVCGYGVGSKENFKKIEKLAAKMGAAIGATRKVVDEGWASSEIQVGQTGKTIAPALYVSFGVSGALQHSIGMRNAKYKIAVNTDPAAPIFKISDVAILGDCLKVAEDLYGKIVK